MPWFLTADFLSKMDRLFKGHNNRPDDRRNGIDNEGRRVGSGSGHRENESAGEWVEAEINKPGGIRERAKKMDEQGADTDADQLLADTQHVRDQIAAIRSHLDDEPDFDGKSDMVRELDDTDAELARVTETPPMALDQLLEDIRNNGGDPTGIGSWDDPDAASKPPQDRSPGRNLPGGSRATGDSARDQNSPEGDGRSPGSTRTGEGRARDQVPQDSGHTAPASVSGQGRDNQFPDDNGVADAGRNTKGWLDNNELDKQTPEGVHHSLNQAAEAADAMESRDTSTPEGKSAWREDALDLQASLDDALRQMQGQSYPGVRQQREMAGALHTDLTKALGNGEEQTDWSTPNKRSAAARRAPSTDAEDAPTGPARPRRSQVPDDVPETDVEPSRPRRAKAPDAVQDKRRAARETNSAVDEMSATEGNDAADALRSALSAEEDSILSMGDKDRQRLNNLGSALDRMSGADLSTPEGRAEWTEAARDAEAATKGMSSSLGSASGELAGVRGALDAFTEDIGRILDKPEKPGKAWRRPRRDTALEIDPFRASSTSDRGRAFSEWLDGEGNVPDALDAQDRARLDRMREKFDSMGTHDLTTNNGREAWKRDALDAESDNKALLDKIGRDDSPNNEDGLNDLRRELRENEDSLDESVGRHKDDKEDEKGVQDVAEDVVAPAAEAGRAAASKAAEHGKSRWRPPWWANNWPEGMNGLNGLDGFGGLPMMDLPTGDTGGAGGTGRKGQQKAKPKAKARKTAAKKATDQANEKAKGLKSELNGADLGATPGVGDAAAGLASALDSMGRRNLDDPVDTAGWHADAMDADHFGGDLASLIGMDPEDSGDGLDGLRSALTDFHSSVAGLSGISAEDYSNIMDEQPLQPTDVDDPRFGEMLDAAAEDPGVADVDADRATSILESDTGSDMPELAALLRGMSVDADNPSAARNLSQLAGLIDGGGADDRGSTQVGPTDNSVRMRWTLPQQPSRRPAAATGEGSDSDGPLEVEGASAAETQMPLGQWLASNGEGLGAVFDAAGMETPGMGSFGSVAEALDDARAGVLEGDGGDDVAGTLDSIDALSDSLGEAALPRMTQGVHESAQITDPDLASAGSPLRSALNEALDGKARVLATPDPQTWDAVGVDLPQIIPEMKALGLLDTAVDVSQAESSLLDTHVDFPNALVKGDGTAAAMSDLAGASFSDAALRAMPNQQVEGYDRLYAGMPMSQTTTQPAIPLGMGAVSGEMLNRGLYNADQAAARLDRFETIIKETGSTAFDAVRDRLSAVANGQPDKLSNAAVAKEWEDLMPDKKPDKNLTAALTASAFPVRPPRAWFADPKLTGPTALTVTPEGRVFGHLAGWNVCHLGKQGCVTAPHSRTGYGYFHTGVVVCDDDSQVYVGRLTMDTGHADLKLNSTAAAMHYDHTGTAVADVSAGEDQWGIWIAGAVRPDVTESQLRVLLASPVSGDWRDVEGNLEMIGALSVNVPGFPVLRPQGFVASGEVRTLVASGFALERDDEDLLTVRMRARALRAAKLRAVEHMAQARRVEAVQALAAKVHTG